MDWGSVFCPPPLASAFVQFTRGPYRFEPERVGNPEDSESENEEVNDRLELRRHILMFL